jgi:hypothetical protein
MRAFELIIESVGLANRKPGDLWKNSQGHELSFVKLEFYPQSGSFPSPEDRDAQLDSLSIDQKKIKWVNSAKNNLLGFAIASFKDQDDNEIYFGKYFQTISPNPIQNSFPNDLPDGFKLQTRSAIKESMPYKASQIFTRFDNLTVNDIRSAVLKKFGQTSDEYQALDIFIKSDFPIKIPKGQINFDSFNNYFTEILQPCALILGKKVLGNAGEAESIFLTEGGYSSCTVSFGAGSNAELFDCKLTNAGGQSVIISSKSGGANKSSAKGLSDKFDEAASSPDGKKIVDRYKDTVDVLKTIVEGGYINGPLSLAVKYKIIDDADADIVRKIKKLSPGPIVGQGILSEKLEAFYQEKTGADPSRIIPFYHLLTVIAYKVADHINKNTNFSEAAAKILNHSGYIKMTSSLTDGKDFITINSFSATYPSDAVKIVKLDAGKNYYSTGNKGNLNFQMLKGR